jgi:hypothetical protein
MLFQMYKRDMGVIAWAKSVYSFAPDAVYSLSIVRPISCDPEKNQITVKICYPIVNKEDMYSVFQVRHRGAFNSDQTIFGYANVADHIGVPLYKDVKERTVKSIEMVDLSKCDLQVSAKNLTL